jgi:thymidine kinase
MPITLICGPMFAGKTEKLISFSENIEGKKTIIKYSEDKRYTELDELISHNGKIIRSSKSINFIYSNVLQDIVIQNNIILLDEGQFFNDLYDFCLQHIEKQIFIAGLDFDFKQEYFKPISDIIPICEVIHKIKGRCMKCDKLESKHSIRTINNNELILIGTSMYIAVCDDCLISEKNN